MLTLWRESAGLFRNRTSQSAIGVGQTASNNAALERSYVEYSHASGLFAVWRPFRAASSMFLVASPTAQVPQFTRPSWIVFPQPRQRLSRRSALVDGGSDGAPFASRLKRCVSRVAGADSRASFCELDQSARVEFVTESLSATVVTCIAHYDLLATGFGF